MCPSNFITDAQASTAPCTPVQLWATPGGQTATCRPLPPPPFLTERSLGWCALWAPPFTRAVAPPPRPRARAGSRAGQRSARPGAPPPAVPQRRGRRVQSTTTPPVPRAVSRCGPPQSCAQGARPRASCSRGAAGSMSMTGRRRVQTEHSPGGLSVRLPWPPCRGLEHQASHNPPHASPPPPPHAGARG